VQHVLSEHSKSTNNHIVMLTCIRLHLGSIRGILVAQRLAITHQPQPLACSRKRMIKSEIDTARGCVQPRSNCHSYTWS
jgi:hypothetical protein